MEPWAWDYDPETRLVNGEEVPSTCPRNLDDYGPTFEKGLAVWWYIEGGKLTLRDVSARDYEHAAACYAANSAGAGGDEDG